MSSYTTVRSAYIKISYCAVFGALAALISILKFEIPMPILFWLKFDFAEIPDMIAYLLGGFEVGIITTFIHMLLLNISATHPIIGPMAKFSAVISMMIGISILRRIKSNPGLISSITTAMVFRVVIMTFVNIIIFYVFLPGVLLAMPKILEPFFGNLGSVEAALLVALALTGVYNAIHTGLTLSLAYNLYEAASKYLKLPKI